MTDDLSQHWEKVHTTKAVDHVSWWQAESDLWLDLIDDRGLAADDPIVDIGSGASLLLDALLARGFRHLTAVDISPAALDRIRRRVGDQVSLVATDVRHFRAAEPLVLWHDRAVFHFLTEESARADYRNTLHTCLAPGGHAIVATFALDGPSSCSGLPVRRYDASGLAAALGFTAPQIVQAEQRAHLTPWGGVQPFTVVVLRRD